MYKDKEAVYNPDEGLHARIRALETWKENSSRVIWMFTAVIGLASAVVIKICKGEMKVKVSYTIDLNKYQKNWLIQDGKNLALLDQIKDLSEEMYLGPWRSIFGQPHQNEEFEY